MTIKKVIRILIRGKNDKKGINKRTEELIRIVIAVEQLFLIKPFH